MTGGLSPAAARAPADSVSPSRTGALTAGETAWLAALPCALLVVAAVMALGPPIGHLLEGRTPALIETFRSHLRPEPTEHARYLLAIAGPLLLSAVVIALARALGRRSSRVTAVLALGAQLLLLGALAGCLAVQHRMTYGAVYGGPLHRVYFTLPTLRVALLLTALALLALNVRRVRGWLTGLLRETPLRRVACMGLAMLATAAWLLTSVQVEASAGGMHYGNQVAIGWWIDETYAVLDGLTPLANFTSPYGHLWPYFAAGAMSLLGASIGVFTVAMASGSGAALIAIFAVFRRILRSSAAALAVYLPFLATGFFMELGPLANRYGPSTLLSMFPMRYAGPYLLAWLTARHVDGTAPRRLTLLFLAAGFVAINGLEFGVPALGATLAAILWTRTAWSWATVGRVLRAAALGVGGAAVLYALFALIRSGSLPDYGALTFYPKLYGVVGYDLLPMPTLGFHLVLYATFAAAIVVATVRAVDRHPDVLLTGMLAWVGAFGLGAGGYFAGRSHPEVLIDLFSAWALALALLLVVVVRAMLARGSRWPRPAELAVLFGFGIAVCSLAQFPTPWSQLRRLRHDVPPWQYGPAAAERFVDRLTKPGEHVAIFMIPSHQIAYDVGVRNVAPYIGWDWMPFKEQTEQTFDALDRSGGSKAFANGGVDEIAARHGLVPAVSRDGFVEYVRRGRGTSGR